MDRDTEKVVAANEALARRVNEAIERGQWPGEEDHDTAYRCECARADCKRLIELTPREYERVRAHSRHFLVAPGHEQPEVETVVQTTPAFLVVAKQGMAGNVAKATDPRE